MKKLLPLLLLFSVGCAHDAIFMGKTEVCPNKSDLILYTMSCVEYLRKPGEQVPPDLLEACEEHARRISCTEEPGFQWARRSEGTWSYQPVLHCSKATLGHELVACRGKGKK